MWDNTKGNKVRTLAKKLFKSKHDLTEKLESTNFITYLISPLAAKTETTKLSRVAGFLTDTASVFVLTGCLERT